MENYFEENIFIESHGLLRYSLSDDLDMIKEAMNKRYGITDYSFIDTFGWSENFNLSENVKKVMNNYNVTYSMTYCMKNGECFLVINKRENNRWFITGFEETSTQYQKNKSNNNFSYYEPKQQKSSSGFGTAFAAGLMGSLTGELIKGILNAGGVNTNKKRK